MLLRLERLVQAHNITMSGSSQDVELLHDLSLGFFLCQELLVDGLEGDKFGCQAMDG